MDLERIRDMGKDLLFMVLILTWSRLYLDAISKPQLPYDTVLT